MRSRISNIPVVIGVAASLALHGSVLVPMLVIAMSAPAQQRPRLGRFDPGDVLPPPPEALPEQRLGLDTPEREASTFTWIGYEEYEEHLAQLSETEQAAFTETPTGAAPTPPSEASDQGQPTEPTEVAEAAEEPSETEPVEMVAENTDTPVESAGDAAADSETRAPTSPQLIPLRAFMPSPDFMIAANAERGPLTLDAGEKPEDPTGEDGKRSGEAQPSEQNPATTPKPSEKPEAKPTQPQPNPKPSTEKQPAKPTPPGEPADQSDRESDATAIVDAKPENWKAGKPLAASGLELKPRRPSFTTLQSLTSAPGNPLVEIRFGKDGKPKDARLLESSGDRTADTSIRSSLYRWRASGAPLKELEGDETIDIRIRILLNRRRGR